MPNDLIGFAVGGNEGLVFRFCSTVVFLVDDGPDVKRGWLIGSREGTVWPCGNGAAVWERCSRVGTVRPCRNGAAEWARCGRVGKVRPCGHGVGMMLVGVFTTRSGSGSRFEQS